MRKADPNLLLDFIKSSPTPFHATANIAEQLNQADYEELDEAHAWTLQAGKKYWISRNDSSIIAFQLPAGSIIEKGLTMIGAHTDSPCLKLKPLPEKISEDYFQTGVEVYGGALLNPWFDRDLSIAGRVTYSDRKGKILNRLMDLERAIATIPSLAIHLDKEANKQRTVNAQLHLPPVWFQAKGKNIDFRDLLKKLLKKHQGLNDINKVLDFELYYYDTQHPAIVGLNNEFIASARLDNLLSCFVGLQAIKTTPKSKGALLVCTDHEEIGSSSACGANGPFLHSVLKRIGQTEENTQRLIHNSKLISVDNAHGIHPNYADKHDPGHKPLINQGPVIKVNANQRYATNSETAGWFRHICESNNIPVQSIAVRSDMGCGSTIGPITASKIGVRTVDIGVPQLAMHSIREFAGVDDINHLYMALAKAISI